MHFTETFQHNLGFVIGLNKSDGTYGWYGNMRGLHLYYNYFTDQGETFIEFYLISKHNFLFLVEEESKSISLSPQLTPTVSFKLMKNHYLGNPYTHCKVTVQSMLNKSLSKWKIIGFAVFLSGTLKSKFTTPIV